MNIIKPHVESVLFKKIQKTFEELKWFHPGCSENNVLNFMFRGGDKPHSRFSKDEECILIPLFVKLKIKPVGGICYTFRNRKLVSKLKERYPELYIKIIKNRWNMYCILISLTKGYDLKGLANESISFTEIGKMYGYSGTALRPT